MNHTISSNRKASLPEATFPRWASIAVCTSLAVAVGIIFGQTLTFSFVNYDDDTYVYDNPEITHGLTLKGILWAFTHIHSYNWHPLTTLTHMFDCQVYGLHPWGHHLDNILLHGMAAILLFLLLQQMTSALWRSAFVAAVFAIHPLHVESVAWISERKDVLSALFFMLTLMAYVRYAQKQESAGRKALPFLFSPSYWLTLLLFGLGLMSKPMLVTLPFLMLLLDYWPLRRFAFHDLSSAKGQLLLEKVPLLLLSAASCVITIWAQKAGVISFERIAFPSRVANALVSYAHYVWHMVYPVDLAVFYPLPASHLTEWRVGVSVLFLSLVSAGIALGYRKHPFLLVGWLWYLGMLVPVIGLIQVGSQAMADRYTYLPQIGLYIIVAWGAVDLCRSWRYRRALIGVGATTIFATLLVLAYVQTTYWKNSASLMTHAIACTPDNFVAHNNLGNTLAEQGNLPEAIQHYERALQLKPDLAETHNSLGSALADQGKLPEAIKQYEEALRLLPDYGEAYNNLGIALAAQGKLTEAIQQYEKAVQLVPDYGEAHNNLGVALVGQGNLSEAIQHYEQAIQLKPNYAEAYNNLGNALDNQGKPLEALQYYERAIQLKPDYAEAYYNAGLVLTRQGKLPEAIERYERVIQLKPNYVAALNNLAYVLATSQNISLRNGVRAIALSERANQLSDGGNPVVLATLAAAYAEAGRFPEAVQTASRGIELASAQGNSALANVLQSRLELYKAKIPLPDRR